MDCLDEPDVRPWNAGLEEGAEELASEGGVTAAASEHLAVHPLVGSERLVRRFAELPVEVCVLDGDRAAGPDRRPHAPQQIDRAAQVLEEEPAEDEIVGLDRPTR